MRSAGHSLQFYEIISYSLTTKTPLWFLLLKVPFALMCSCMSLISSPPFALVWMAYSCSPLADKATPITLPPSSQLHGVTTPSITVWFLASRFIRCYPRPKSFLQSQHRGPVHPLTFRRAFSHAVRRPGKTSRVNSCRDSVWGHIALFRRDRGPGRALGTACL